MFIAIVIAFIFGLIGIVGVWMAYDERKRLAEIRATKTTPLKAVDAGVKVEVQGIVEDLGAFEAPLSGRQCVYARWGFSYTDVMEKTQSVHDRRGSEIWFHDDSGRGKVILDDRVIVHRTEHSLLGPIGEEGLHSDPAIDERVKALLAEQDSPPREREPQLQFHENTIVPGDKLYVMGQAELERVHDGRGTYRGLSQVAVFAHREGEDLYVSTGSEDEVEENVAGDGKLYLGCGVVFLLIAAAVLATGLYFCAP